MGVDYRHWVDNRGGEIIVSWEEVQTLPEGCDTIEAAIKECWDE